MTPNFPHPIRGAVLGDPGITPPAFPYGAITLYGGPFQGTSGQRAGVGPGPITPHPRRVVPCGFGLGSSPFPRRYSGNPILVSFPPPTWMFPFGGFPIPGASTPGIEGWEQSPQPSGDPIRRSPDQRPPAATRGFSQLATSFLGARAEASTGRRTRVQGRLLSSRRCLEAYERGHRTERPPASDFQRTRAGNLHRANHFSNVAAYKYFQGGGCATPIISRSRFYGVMPG